MQHYAANDLEENKRRGIEALEAAATAGADLIIFPELSFSPFYPGQPATGNVIDLAETIPGPTTEIFSDLARKWNVVVVINIFERSGDMTYDSSPVIDSDGTILGVTRMVHIIDAPCFHERGYYHPGDGDRQVFDTHVAKVGVAICYDRHFPEYMRALSLGGAEIVVVPQAGAVGEWPPGLFEAEMRVAGFQNGYFTALCNRVGGEECIVFEGKSFITAPDGRIITRAPAEEETVLSAEINLDEIEECHAHRHFLRDRRPDIYTTWFRGRNSR